MRRLFTAAMLAALALTAPAEALDGGYRGTITVDGYATRITLCFEPPRAGNGLHPDFGWVSIDTGLPGASLEAFPYQDAPGLAQIHLADDVTLSAEHTPGGVVLYGGPELPGVAGIALTTNTPGCWR
jgi:hypothetical protein